MDRVVQSELDLIGHIYDAVLEPDRWSDAIDRIRRYVGLHLGAIGVNYFPTGVSIQATTNIAPEYVQAIADTADTLQLMWGGPDAFSRLPVEDPIRMLDYSSPDWWPGNPFYEKFCRPLGLVDQLVLLLENNSSMMASFALGRHESMPPIGKAQIETFRVLAPHLRRAVLIGSLLEARSVATSSLQAALDVLGSAVLLVDANVRIIYANGLAEDMLRRGDPISRLRGRLDVPREVVKGQFRNSIAAAARDEEALHQGGGLAVRRSDGSGMVIHVLPLGRRTLPPPSTAVAAVFVATPNSELSLPLEAMRLLYDLRPAEVRVLELIARGANGNAVADALGISKNTAKTHTLRLFDKLGVHSRVELLRLTRDMSARSAGRS